MHGKQHSVDRYCLGDVAGDVDTFLEGVEAFNRRDVERWLDVFHPDAVFEPQGVEGDYSGRDELRRFFADLAESFEMFELTSRTCRTWETACWGWEQSA